MYPIQLPFDPDRMLAYLRPWVEGGSSIHDAAAVNRMMDLASRDQAIMGATVERISGIEPGGPSHATARLAGGRSAIPAMASHIAEI